MTTWLLSLDVTSVLVFVIAGRSTHGIEETVPGVAHTAAPFLIALGAGWVAARAWKSPSSIRTGLIVLASTVVVGMALRRLVFGDGIAATFVLVTAAFLTLFLLGWRLVVALGRRSASPPVSGNPASRDARP